MLEFLVFTYLAVAHAETRTLSLLEAINLAATSNPELKRDRLRVSAAAADTRVQRSRYLPDVSANAVLSTGDPGSFSMMDVDSNLSSSQRIGSGAALALKQDVWDFGRTASAVATAEGERAVSEKRADLSTAEVNLFWHSKLNFRIALAAGMSLYTFATIEH